MTITTGSHRGSNPSSTSRLGHRQPMGSWSLTWASGSINDERPLTEEAAV
jgi:hypothetical protein